MKEAAGEANMTVITIVLVAIVLVIGGLVVRGTMNNTKAKSCCTSAGGYYYQNDCWATYDKSTNTYDKKFTPNCSDADS